MNEQLLFNVIMVLCVVLVGMYFFIVVTKLSQSRAAKMRLVFTARIMPDLNPILEGGTANPRYNDYVKHNLRLFAKKDYLNKMEGILLELLEDTDHPHWRNTLQLSHDLGLPQRCLPLIQSRNNRNIAVGCRKAGLYMYTGALPYMRGALRVFTSETQFQILMAISRIGDVDSMVSAFNDISRFVMLNERAAFQILSVFSGNRQELYRRMLHCDEPYVVALFLKSLDPDTAKALARDIIRVYDHANKEVRVAVLRAIDLSAQPEFVEHIIDALGDIDWEVRAIAARSLGSCGSDKVGVALARMVTDREWWVRQNAASSLLSCPNCRELFLDIIRSGDTYARDSVIHVLETSQRSDILTSVTDLITEMETEKVLESRKEPTTV